MKRLIIALLFLTFLPRAYSQASEDSLSLKIGQMIMVGFSGTSVSDDDPILEEISKGDLGGIIMFEKNIADSNSFAKLSQLNLKLQEVAEVPLFLAIDQEGGKVNRLKTKYGFPKSVTAEYLGKLDNEDTTRHYAAATVKILADLNFNVNFAPVLDLASNPDNPVIVKYGRSFGADPKLVYKHAGIVVREHNKQNIITVGKHFPGHGSSESDTHFGIADVTSSWDKSELVPYKKLIKDGILPGVMSAHIVNASLDKDSLPGTLSEDILQGILREKLDFEGIIFSDDMQMHAITKHYGLENAIELGLNAGLDVIIFSNNIRGSEERTVSVVHEIILRLVNEGRIPIERINESYTRIMKYKKQYLYD